MMPLDAALAAFVPPPPPADAPGLFAMDPAQARAIFAGIAATKGGSIAGVATEDRSIDTPAGALAIRIYRPERLRSDATIVFLHGGGYMLGTLDQMDMEASTLSDGVGAVVVSVDYRLAPEHRLPAAHEDAMATLTWARAHAAELGGNFDRLVVAGESAGANIAASTAIAARDIGLPLAAQLLIVPAPDFAAMAELPDGDYPMLVPQDLRDIAAICLPVPEVARRFPYSAAGADDFTGLPPTVIGLAGHCPTLPIGLAYAEQLREAGTVVHLRLFEDMFHPFFAFTQAAPAAKLAADTLFADLHSLLECDARRRERHFRP